MLREHRFIYFIQQEGASLPPPGPRGREARSRREKYGGPIKIGVANDVSGRLADLQVGNPQQLSLCGFILAPDLGARAVESWLHGHLARHSIRGEWFEPSGWLFRFIDEAEQNDHHLTNHQLQQIRGRQR